MKESEQPKRRPTAPQRDAPENNPGPLSNDERVTSGERLARALAQATRPPPGLTHAECQALLDLYVNDQQEGQDVEVLYPAVWQHLQTCEQCALVYRRLDEALREIATSSSEAVPVPGTYAPISSPQPGMDWHTEIASRLLGDTLRLSFLFSLNHIKNVLGLQPPARALRSIRETSEQTLLFENVQVGDEHVIVKVRIESTAQRLNLHLTVVPEGALDSDWRAHLRWGDKEYRRDLPKGEGVIENVSPPPLTDPLADTPSPNFCLTIEPLGDERV